MSDYNLVVVVGKLEADPELRYTADKGVPNTTLKIRVRRPINNPDGVLKHKSIVVEAVTWRHQAEIAAQFLKTGSTVMAVGVLESKRGQLRIRVERLQFLDRKPAANEVAP